MIQHGPKVDAALASEHGLAADEYEKLCDGLGRDPSYTELGVVSVMWSEHCSYKSSRIHLKTLPSDGPQVIEGPGENAGVVDIGDGQAVVFKMESHNHPSFLEPYQGAATGVGGICRDVFTMGARPIAIADCLRFGNTEHERTSYLLHGVVAGVGDYGNCFGVPNVTGDVVFDDSYNGNILVNAFCLGLAKSDRIFRGYASGVGNPILYVGAKTGRDGIHGATMASAEFAEGSDEKRPAVQVGDPFMEKLLLEACLELMEEDVLVGIQDMGAAGLTSCSVEMAARAGSGVELHLENVPMREEGMTPYELMLSESQERMLMVVTKGKEQKALDIFAKWDLDAAVVGEVTESGKVIVKMHKEVYADLPATLLAEGLKYDRPRKRPDYLDEVAYLTLDSVADPTNLGQTLLEMLAAPNICDKSWVFEQYDHMVRHGTVVRPGQASSGVVRVFEPESGRSKGVAIAAGCNSRHVYLAPYEGSRLAVASAYADLVAVGATPLATTDCLNFGNPEKPGIMWQFAESIRGIGDACRLLETPIVSGNVSLYNETDGEAIKPTPMIGMVGLLDDIDQVVTAGFKEAGHRIAVVGTLAGGLGGSEYLKHCHGIEEGAPVAFDMAKHSKVFAAMLEMTKAKILSSAEDVSDGGLLCCISECCLGGEALGANISLPVLEGRLDELCFGEGPARFLVSYTDENAASVARMASGCGVGLLEIGCVGGRELRVSVGGELRLDEPIDALARAFHYTFERIS
ncbi:MAG: phosphoribosylformylglycinamidine synthase subunit PurL [Myxococcales bacterium]|nr:phosphoribosylformylglycinamidine synthase subunit PurL [Myxococcales bacterium]